MTTLPLALCLASSAFMTGVLWLVQLAIYPLFRDVPPHAFVAYHLRYTWWVSFVVVPGILLEIGVSAWLMIAQPVNEITLSAHGLLVVALLSTFALQVPLHNRLRQGFDRTTHFKLVRTNWIRTVAWTLRTGLLVAVIWV